MRGTAQELGELIQKRPTTLDEKWGVLLKDPAATYSPTQLPVQYHRP